MRCVVVATHTGKTTGLSVFSAIIGRLQEMDQGTFPEIEIYFL